MMDLCKRFNTFVHPNRVIQTKLEICITDIEINN